MFGNTKKSECTDAAIVAGLLSGSGRDFDRAVECLDRNCKPRVTAWLRQHGAPAGDAEDLFQDAVIELLLALARGAVISSTPCGFLFGIARNLWLKKLRSNRRDDLLQKALLADAREDQLDPVIPALMQQDAVVQTCWEQLSERCRDILTDYYQGSLSFEQIADKYDYASAHAARQTKMRCLKYLRDCVGLKKDLTVLSFEF